MQLEIGKIYEGKVTGITKFGAFIEFDKETTGMVHISEVANGFVTEIKDHIQEGQMIKVKVMSIGDDGKISLSIKKAVDTPRPPRQNNFKRDDKGFREQNHNNSRPPRGQFKKQTNQAPSNSFEDMLSKFKQNSEEKMSDLKKNIDSKRRNSSRRSGSKY